VLILAFVVFVVYLLPTHQLPHGSLISERGSSGEDSHYGKAVALGLVPRFIPLAISINRDTKVDWSNDCHRSEP